MDFVEMNISAPVCAEHILQNAYTQSKATKTSILENKCELFTIVVQDFECGCNCVVSFCENQMNLLIKQHEKRWKGGK